MEKRPHAWKPSLLQDFHPMATGLAAGIAALREQYAAVPPRTACSRDRFLALLAGVPALRKTPGIPGPGAPGYFTTLPRCATAQDAAACRAHLQQVFGITDQESMLRFCNQELRCQEQYLDFEAFWEGRPPFALSQLNEDGRRFFTSARDFAAQFYALTDRRGFLAWDISECMGHLRAAYACGILERAFFDELAEHWIVQAQTFSSWLEFAVSLVCGELYWDFRNQASPADLQKGQELWLRLVRTLLDDRGAWGSGAWYTPPRRKPYLLWPPDVRTLLRHWDGPEGCFATDHITVLGKPVGWCYREKTEGDFPDSGWRFFSGEETPEYINDTTHTGAYTLNAVCNYDPSILPLLHAPCGSAFRRGSDGTFHQEQFTPPKS